MDHPTNYPLAWPLGYKRTNAYLQAPFKSGTRGKLTVNQSVERVESQFEAFNKRGHRPRASGLIISTNIQPTLSGRPRSNTGEPRDPGVAVYFVLDGKNTVLCCDKWHRVADNLAAIAATIDALRGIDRWGVAEASRAFVGFEALPAPGESKVRTCWTVLGLVPRAGLSKQEVDAAWREKARICHPDKPGGSHEGMAELNAARDQAIRAIGGNA